jgi:hypothetical protein
VHRIIATPATRFLFRRTIGGEDAAYAIVMSLSRV